MLSNCCWACRPKQPTRIPSFSLFACNVSSTVLSLVFLLQACKYRLQNDEEAEECGKYDSYRADGLYGQYSVILPAQEAVITCTAESRNQKQLLETLLDAIVPQL